MNGIGTVLRSGVLLLLTGAALAGCGGERSVPADGGPEEMVFAEELGVELDRMTRTESGLHFEDVQAGEGAEAVPGTTAVVHYTGWLPDGTRFDSSRDRGEPFAFRLGAGEVIAGWDQGVAGMRVGGRRKLVVPAELAYGSRGAGGVIPPGATLVFDVELLEVGTR